LPPSMKSDRQIGLSKEARFLRNEETRIWDTSLAYYKAGIAESMADRVSYYIGFTACRILRRALDQVFLFAPGYVEF